ncbi:hypothetical protein [Sedimentitalea todarodis]|uniref:Sulfotransferase family protein n=1 Tax=Sedimentitalea todarodis TaxID=1631240 RepID=A0ABU3VBX0_9RHOB|nr:hypothetical protein [Sedimentitalea todarodis]MDU9003672.1 hypothetical protein [Sedimentitalea todarodis]
MAQRADTPPTRFQVLGERSSGTNLVKRLLGRNSALQPTEALGWKHGFPQAMAIPADLAVICVVRNAVDWALSMHSKPWHTVPELQRLAFSDFIRTPWQTVIDRPRYFDGVADTVGQPLLQDRDPVTGRTFENLMALRRAKLASLMGYLNRDCTCVVLRMEEVQTEPERRIDALLSALEQPRRETPFRPVGKRLGSKFKPAVQQRPQTPDRISSDDLAYLLAHLDRDAEARLGYLYESDET